MQIYLASMLEPKNFGSGKIIAIANTKPDELQVDGLYSHFIPKNEYIEKYNQIKLTLLENPNALKDASKYFNDSFYEQLKEFLKKLNKTAKEENKSMMDILPFKQGDTLVSWEREGYTNYRGMVAGLLKKIGYDVILK